MTQDLLYKTIKLNLEAKNLNWDGLVFDKSSKDFVNFFKANIGRKRYLLLKLKDDYVYFDTKSSAIIPTFQIDDIIEYFAENKKLYWNGDLHFSDKDIKAKPTDFLPQKDKKSNLTRSVSIKVLNPTKLSNSREVVEISSMYFKIMCFDEQSQFPYFETDSNTWQSFLLKKHPEQYAPIYYDIYKSKYNRLISQPRKTKGIFVKKPIYSEDEIKALNKYKQKMNEASQYFETDCGIEKNA